MNVKFIDNEGLFNIFVRKTIYNSSVPIQNSCKFKKPIKLGPHMDRLSLVQFLTFREAHMICNKGLPYFEGPRPYFVLRTKKDLILECFFFDHHLRVKIDNWDCILELVMENDFAIIIDILTKLPITEDINPPKKKYNIMDQKIADFIIWLDSENQIREEKIHIPIAAFCDYIPQNEQEILDCFLTIHRIGLSPRDKKHCLRLLSSPQFKETCSVFRKNRRDNFPIDFYSRRTSEKNLKKYHSSSLEKLGFSFS